MESRTAVLAVAGAFALGAVGTNALADDDDGAERVNPVKIGQEDGRGGDRDDRRDDRGDDSRGEPGRNDDDDIDAELRDDDDDAAGGDGDSDSAGAAGGGGDSASAVAASPAPAPTPAPVYDDDYASDYGDT